MTVSLITLCRELGELGADLTVYRNDKITVDEIRALEPDRIVISPGPGYPCDAGVSLEVIRELGAQFPLLGVCLGHQAIGEAYGGKVVHAPELMHGKTSMIYHRKDTIFGEIPDPFEATRYHSLIVEEESLPDCLMITARTASGEIMGLRHKQYPVIGVQFSSRKYLDGLRYENAGQFSKVSALKDARTVNSQEEPTMAMNDIQSAIDGLSRYAQLHTDEAENGHAANHERRRQRGANRRVFDGLAYERRDH